MNLNIWDRCNLWMERSERLTERSDRPAEGSRGRNQRYGTLAAEVYGGED
jgi:hypothetical protein